MRLTPSSKPAISLARPTDRNAAEIYKRFMDQLWEHMNDPKIRFSTVERAWSWKPRRQNTMYDIEVSSDRPDFTACYDELAGRRELMRPTCASDEARETSSSSSSSDISMEEAPAPAPIPQVSVVVNRKFTTRDLGKPGGGALVDPDKPCPLHPLPIHYHCHHNPPADFADIIRLSQVSGQVTRKLGECLWENAAVEFDDAGTLIMFARERPAALPFIRGIALGIDCIRDAPNFHTDTDELATALSLVSEHLDLRFFDVKQRALVWDKTAIFESSVQDLLGIEVVDWAPWF
jgi:hypothetical protein